jgi:hypothetical protein
VPEINLDRKAGFPDARFHTAVKDAPVGGRREQHVGAQFPEKSLPQRIMPVIVQSAGNPDDAPRGRVSHRGHRRNPPEAPPPADIRLIGNA